MARYQDELERLAFSAEEKEALTRRLLAAGREEEPKRSRPPSYRALVAIVAAVSLLVGAVGAVSLAGVSPEFRAMFGITDQEGEQNLGALPVNQTFTDKNGSGSSITVREVVRDQERLYILMDFTAPEGTVLPTPERGEGLNDWGYWLYGDDGRGEGDEMLSIALFADGACTRRTDPDRGWGWHIEALADDDPTDNVVTLLYAMTTDRGLPEGARYCRINHIFNLYTTEGGELKTVVGGMDIEVVIPIPEDTQTYAFGGRCPVKLGGTTMAVVENLTISPISLSLDLVIPDSEAYDAAFAERGPWQVYVLLNDGTEVAAQYPEGIYGRLDRFYSEPGEVDQEGGLFFRADHAVLTLEKPIDVSQIEDIVFVGDNDAYKKHSPGGTYVHFFFSPEYFYNDTYWDQVNENWKKTEG